MPSQTRARLAAALAALETGRPADAAHYTNMPL